MEKQIKKQNYTKIFLVSLFLVSMTITLGIYYLNFKTRELSASPEQWGQFGDYFNGTIGPILSTISAFLIYKTFQTEKQQFNEQQKEVENAKVQDKKKEEERLNEVLKVNFDRKFFELLKIYHDINSTATNKFGYDLKSFLPSLADECIHKFSLARVEYKHLTRNEFLVTKVNIFRKLKIYYDIPASMSKLAFHIL